MENNLYLCKNYKQMKKFFTPLEEIKGTGKTTILATWLIALITFWVACSFVK